MNSQATGIYNVTSWEEGPYDEVEGATKLTQAKVKQTFSGDIVGEGTATYLMVYPIETSAHFVGLHRVIGALGGRSGSFVLEATGVFANGTVQTNWHVVPGSAKGELTGLSGEGGYTTSDTTMADYTLTYRLGE